MRRSETGKLGEKLAQDFLKKKGYTILETNYRCPRVEIDIIARHEDCLVFVEVRTKTSSGFGSPEESITPIKIRHLERAAMYYLQNHTNLPELWRLDLVAIELDMNNKAKRIELIPNAFEI